MKTHYKLLIICSLLLSLTLISCSSSGALSNNNNSGGNQGVTTDTSMAEALSHLMGLNLYFLSGSSIIPSDDTYQYVGNYKGQDLYFYSDASKNVVSTVFLNDNWTEKTIDNALQFDIYNDAEEIIGEAFASVNIANSASWGKIHLFDTNNEHYISRDTVNKPNNIPDSFWSRTTIYAGYTSQGFNDALGSIEEYTVTESDDNITIALSFTGLDCADTSRQYESELSITSSSISTPNSLYLLQESAPLADMDDNEVGSTAIRIEQISTFNSSYTFAFYDLDGELVPTTNCD